LFSDTELLDQHFTGNLAKADFRHSEVANSSFQCNLERAEFLGAEFFNCTFTECNFTSALLTGVRFTGCSFARCNFDEAYIFRSQFKNCTIEDCELGNAMLSTVDFTSTSLKNVDWRGSPINSAPIIIEGIEYPVVALDNGHMHVGCEYNTYEWFYNTDEKHSAKMEGLRARRFWKKNKQWLFFLLESRGLFKP
jgi:hypothetical protein